MIPLMERRGKLSLVVTEAVSLTIRSTALPVGLQDLEHRMLFCTVHFNFDFFKVVKFW